MNNWQEKLENRKFITSSAIEVQKLAIERDEDYAFLPLLLIE